MSIVHPFIGEIIPMLERQGYAVVDLSNLSGLDIKLPAATDESITGQLWIEGTDERRADRGQVVVRVHSKMVEIAALPTVLAKMAEKAVLFLNDNPGYDMHLTTSTWWPDANEPEDAPVRVSTELRLIRKWVSPEVALQQVSKFLSLPQASIAALFGEVVL